MSFTAMVSSLPIILVLFTNLELIFSYRVLNLTEIHNATFEDVFVPYNKSFVGTYGDPTNFLRERINEGIIAMNLKYTNVPNIISFLLLYA